MQQFFSKIFGKPLGFEPIDPLGNGLAEEIEQERHEPQAIHLDDLELTDDLQRFWAEVETDIHGGNAVEFSEE